MVRLADGRSRRGRKVIPPASGYPFGPLKLIATIRRKSMRREKKGLCLGCGCGNDPLLASSVTGWQSGDLFSRVWAARARCWRQAEVTAPPPSRGVPSRRRRRPSPPAARLGPAAPSGAASAAPLHLHSTGGSSGVPLRLPPGLQRGRGTTPGWRCASTRRTRRPLAHGRYHAWSLCAGPDSAASGSQRGHLRGGLVTTLVLVQWPS